MSAASKEALRRRVETEHDFVNMKRFDYSLTRCAAKYPEGMADDRAIAAALCIDEADIPAHMQRIALELRARMGVEVEEPYTTPRLWLMLAPILPPGTLED